MKLQNTLSKTLSAMVVLLAFAISVSAEEPMKPMKGGEHLMMLSHINTQAQAEALTTNDSVAMVCSMCKSVTVYNVDTKKGVIKTMTVGEKHLCPGCGSEITVVGMGKGKHDVVKHVCGKCGGESAFCCANKPGGEATKGMEKDDDKK